MNEAQLAWGDLLAILKVVARAVANFSFGRANAA